MRVLDKTQASSSDPAKFVHASDLESAELPESPTDKAIRILSGPLGQIPEQWASNPESKELQSKMFDLLRELGWIKKLPTEK